MRIVPEIFVPRELPMLQLKDVFLEQQHPQIDIIWYHWPQDGIFIGIPDYEPIVVIFSENNELEVLAPRRGWEYEPVSGSELSLPIQIVFGGLGGLTERLTQSFHHPYPHTLDHDDSFDNILRGKVLQSYDLTLLTTSTDIPPVARIGKNHPSLKLKTGKDSVIDPFDWALDYLNNYL